MGRQLLVQIVLCSFRERSVFQNAQMITLNISRTELELLVNAVELAGKAGWPAGDDSQGLGVEKAA